MDYNHDNLENSRPLENFGSFPVPNATAVLVLGILSIPGCCCLGGLVGVILGVVALVLAKQAEEAYRLEPGNFTQSSYKNMQAGRVCAIIGLVLSGIALLLVISRLVFGLALLGGGEEMLEEILRELQ